jgi:hypothetical protein
LEDAEIKLREVPFNFIHKGNFAILIFGSLFFPHIRHISPSFFAITCLIDIYLVFQLSQQLKAVEDQFFDVKNKLADAEARAERAEHQLEQ